MISATRLLCNKSYVFIDLFCPSENFSGLRDAQVLSEDIQAWALPTRSAACNQARERS